MNLFLKNLQAIVLPFILSVTLTFFLNRYSVIVTQNWYYGLLFLLVLSFILNLVYARKAGSSAFTQLLITAIVVKLLLGLIVIVVYSFADRDGFFNFSIQFILHYILFTIFEIRYLLHILKTHSNKI